LHSSGQNIQQKQHKRRKDLFWFSFKGVSPSWQGGCGRAEQFTSEQPESREKGKQEKAKARCTPEDYFLLTRPYLLPFI
jgi:hypothetical protein